MAKIDQIQIKFIAVEDRLLLKVSSEDDLEFLFWMTRRFVKLIWPLLLDALKESPAIKTQAPPEVKKELLAFEHEKAVHDADFNTPYKETERTLPLGTTPLLLAKMQMKRRDDGTVVLGLGPEQGAGIDLALTNQLLHSLVEIIDNGAKIAEWELPPSIASAPPARPDDVTIN